MAPYRRLENLDVYLRLCRLHIEVCDLSHDWPAEERYELGTQVRRASNSSPAQLAEKQDDWHVRNKIEGVNRSRGEAGETIHHLFMARLKDYITEEIYEGFRSPYPECILMLNGLERTLEQRLPPEDRCWPQTAHEHGALYEAEPSGYPVPDDPPLEPPSTASPLPPDS